MQRIDLDIPMRVAHDGDELVLESLSSGERVSGPVVKNLILAACFGTGDEVMVNITLEEPPENGDNC
jgi:hypothetical protein